MALTPNDLYAFVGVSDPNIVRVGSTVYYARTSFDRAADAQFSTIWRVDHDASTARAFTSGTKDRMPRPSPTGTTLAFVAERDESTRIHLMPTSGGEARPLGESYKTVTSLVWSPDGTKLAFTATTEHDPTTAKIFHDEISGARHIRALPFKSDDDGLLDGTRKHLFVIHIASGACERVTSGDFDVNAPAWSPDGTRIAFGAAIGLPEWSFRSDVHVVTLANKAIVSITHGEGQQSDPAFSNDGTQIAFVGHRHGDAGGRVDTELFVVPASGGEPASLSAARWRTMGFVIASDLRAGPVTNAPAWSPDDREIFVLVSDEGKVAIEAYPRTGGAHRVVAGGARAIAAFSCADDGSVAFDYATPTIPSDLALVRDGRETRLTHVNDALLVEKGVISPTHLRAKTADGIALDVWILKPSQPQTAPPFVLEVHGGPHFAYGYAFFLEFQILAAMGFVVAYGNPRGGQSYGAAFSDAITGDWGGMDVADVLTILDAAISETKPDPKRIGVAGGSYGGFMTTWLLGHSDRFAAGVSMRSVNDFVSEVGASDMGWFLEAEVGGPYDLDAGRKLFENSPMRAADKIGAPLLVEHSERDYRCPIDQGEQLFTLLRRFGRTDVEFVRFTGDGHSLSRTGKPRNRVLRLRAIAHWFLRHLAPAGIAIPADTAGALFAPLPGEVEPVA